ncbi:MAG: Uma2 family endonuclease [Isosphaeraceae bacterium]
MAISTSPSIPPAGPSELPGHGAIPPLENGDHLTREEFERRYDPMPGLKKAELIEGVVDLPSPVPHREHGPPHARLITWLGNYETDTPGVGAGLRVCSESLRDRFVGWALPTSPGPRPVGNAHPTSTSRPFGTDSNGSIRLNLDNEPQPDGYLIILPACGGQARISDDDYVEEAPELIAEVSVSSASIDLGKKFDVYRRNGVREYLVWRVLDRQVAWYVNRGGRFEDG